MPLNPGDILSGHYRIEAEIGRGTYGRVYRARDTKLDRPIAIKELARGVDELGSSVFADYVRRFEREARVQAGFNHPNIVHVYELIQESADRLYLVMEYVDGESLRDQLVRRGPLPVDEAVRITSDLLAGLAVVHADPRDIVHRDVKPSNVLLTKSGQAKLADFGLAQVGDESMRSGAGQPHPGTPAYMSPEQEQTNAYLYPASDLFSVGCVLFEMLTGMPYKRAKKERKGLTDLRPDAPPWLGEIVAVALAKDHDDRPANATEMGRLLGEGQRIETDKRMAEERARQEMQRKAEEEAERVRQAEQERQRREAEERTRQAAELQAQAEADRKRREAEKAELARREAERIAQVEAESARHARRLQEEHETAERTQLAAAPHSVARRRWLPWAIGGMAILMLLLVLIKRDQSGDLVYRFGEAPQAAVPMTWSNAVTPSLPGTPIPQSLPPITSENAEQVKYLARWGKGKANSIALSPSGGRLAVATVLGVYIYDSQSFAEDWRLNGAANEIAYSPDGRLATANGGAVTIWNATNGVKITNLSGNTDSVNSLLFSPDGKLLASGSEKEIIIRETANWQILTTLAEDDKNRAFSGASFSQDSRFLASGYGNSVLMWDSRDTWSKRVIGSTSESPCYICVYATMFSPDQRSLVSSGSGGGLTIWDLIGNDPATTLPLTDSTGTVGYVAESIAYSPDGKLLAAGVTAGSRIFIYDTANQTVVGEIASPNVDKILFALDGSTLFSSSDHDLVKAWDYRTGKELRALPEHGGWIYDVVSTSDGKAVAVANGGRVVLRDTTTGNVLQAFDLADVVYAVDLQLYPGSLVAGMQTKTVQMDLSNASTMQTFGGANSIDYSASQSRLAIGTWEEAQIWDVPTGKKTCSSKQYGWQVVALSPDGNTLISGAADGTIWIIDSKDCSVIKKLTGHSDWLEAVTFSPNGQQLVTGDNAGEVRFWNTSTWASTRVLSHIATGVSHIAFSKSGQVIALATDQGIVLLNPKNGEVLTGVTSEPIGRVRGVTFSLDDRLLIAGFEDGTVRAWGVTQ